MWFLATTLGNRRDNIVVFFSLPAGVMAEPETRRHGRCDQHTGHRATEVRQRWRGVQIPLRLSAMLQPHEI